MKILAVDVGGTHVKILASGQKQRREIVSGSQMTARKMVSTVRKLAQGWTYDVVSIGLAIWDRVGRSSILLRHSVCR